MVTSFTDTVERVGVAILLEVQLGGVNGRWLAGVGGRGWAARVSGGRWAARSLLRLGHGHLMVEPLVPDSEHLSDARPAATSLIKLLSSWPQAGNP